MRHVACAALVLSMFVVSGCGPGSDAPTPPTLDWNQQKYGTEPTRRPLSTVEITTEVGWVTAREKASIATPAGSPATCTAHWRIGGMDCGDCQHLVADELGKLAGVHRARVSQPPLEAAQESAAGKVDPQSGATGSSRGLRSGQSDSEADRRHHLRSGSVAKSDPLSGCAIRILRFQDGRSLPVDVRLSFPCLTPFEPMSRSASFLMAEALLLSTITSRQLW